MKSALLFSLLVVCGVENALSAKLGGKVGVSANIDANIDASAGTSISKDLEAGYDSAHDAALSSKGKIVDWTKDAVSKVHDMGAAAVEHGIATAENIAKKAADIAEAVTSAKIQAASQLGAKVQSSIGSAFNVAENLAEKFGPGNMMGHMATAVEKGLHMKNEVVNGSLEMVKDGVSFGITAAGHMIDGAKGMVQVGHKTAENVKTAATTGAGSMVSKVFSIANSLTGGKVSSITGAMNSTAQAGISAGDKMATMGMNLGNNVGSKGLDLGKSIVGKIGSGTTGVMDVAGRTDKAINAKISGGFSAAAGAASSAGVKLANIMSTAWKMPTKSSA